MFIINAPLFFKVVWEMIKPWLDEKTRLKISVLDTNYLPKLREQVGLPRLKDY